MINRSRRRRADRGSNQPSASTPVAAIIGTPNHTKPPKEPLIRAPAKPMARAPAMPSNTRRTNGGASARPLSSRQQGAVTTASLDPPSLIRRSSPAGCRSVRNTANPANPAQTTAVGESRSTPASIAVVRAEVIAHPSADARRAKASIHSTPAQASSVPASKHAQPAGPSSNQPAGSPPSR